jgi:hypothetical protein
MGKGSGACFLLQKLIVYFDDVLPKLFKLTSERLAAEMY